ncbi:hypothetical protein DKX38_005141 [Salix brachista]|uniref:Xylanase inhibitor C-terminal domain-containing protein n=1 Tax=Salix brachista TaxID=2182728 RepID=A0A5N5NDL2_9ROSI|nr:hypothetical protein DKX38_005141 [Salix brachista]
MQVRPSPAYYVNFLGKSVNGVKLNISKTDLAIEKDGGGGCVIDCGALAALLVKPSFDTVHTALADQKTEETHHSQFEGKNIFCLLMLSDDSKTIIGVYQKMKRKFVYDTKAQVLSFGLED